MDLFGNKARKAHEEAAVRDLKLGAIARDLELKDLNGVYRGVSNLLDKYPDDPQIGPVILATLDAVARIDLNEAFALQNSCSVAWHIRKPEWDREVTAKALSWTERMAAENPAAALEKISSFIVHPHHFPDVRMHAREQAVGLLDVAAETRPGLALEAAAHIVLFGPEQSDNLTAIAISKIMTGLADRVAEYNADFALFSISGLNERGADEEWVRDATSRYEILAAAQEKPDPVPTSPEAFLARFVPQ